MKKLYVVNYWVPFPASEYGGLVVVTAESDEQCYEILVAAEDSYNSNHFPKAWEAVKKAQVFNLVEDVESKIVEKFTT